MHTAKGFIAVATAAAIGGHASCALAEGGVEQAKAEVEKAEAMPQFVGAGSGLRHREIEGKARLDHHLDFRGAFRRHHSARRRGGRQGGGP